MVAATGTNTLGFIVRTVALTIVTWLASVIQRAFELRNKGILDPLVTAIHNSVTTGLYTSAAVIGLAMVAWSIAVISVVYKDHVALVERIAVLHEELAKRGLIHFSLRIKGWIDNQDQNQDAIVQVWLAVDNSGQPDTLSGWQLSIKAGDFVREGTHGIGQPTLKGSLTIPFLDTEFQRPVGTVADVQGYVTFRIKGMNQQEFDNLYLDRSAILVVSAVDSKGMRIEAAKNIYQTWLEGHETVPAR